MDTSLPRTTTILDILNASIPDAPLSRFRSRPPLHPEGMSSSGFIIILQNACGFTVPFWFFRA
jgi:hypothetical protein